MSQKKLPKVIRDKHIQIRLTADEVAQIKIRAGDLGSSTFLRQLALGQKIEPPKPKPTTIIHSVDPELIRNVAWIGNNINQIAKHLNSGNKLDNDVLMALVELQATLDTEIKRIVSYDR